MLSSSFLQDGLEKSTPEPVGHHHRSLLIMIYKIKENKFNEIFKYFFHTSWPWRVDARSCRTSSLMLFSGNEVNSMFSFVCCSGFVQSLAGLLSFVKKTTTTKTKTLIYRSSTGHFLRLTIIILYDNISWNLVFCPFKYTSNFHSVVTLCNEFRWIKD